MSGAGAGEGTRGLDQARASLPSGNLPPLVYQDGQDKVEDDQNMCGGSSTKNVDDEIVELKNSRSTEPGKQLRAMPESSEELDIFIKKESQGAESGRRDRDARSRGA